MNTTRPAVPARAAILCVLGATLCFAALDTTTQVLAAQVSVAMMLWTRYVFQVLSTAAVLASRLGAGLWQARRPGLQLLRGVLLAATSLFAVLSLQHIPVGLFTAVVMLTPVALTVVSSLVFGERVAAPRWLLLALGFAGAMLVVRPGSGAFGWAAVLPLLTLVANTGFQLCTSRLSTQDRAGTTHFLTGLVGLVLTSVALALTGWPTTLPLLTWGLLVVLALLTSVGHFLLILAYRRAPASLVAPFLYGQVGFATLAGWLFLGQRLDSWALAGIALIVSAGLASVHSAGLAVDRPGLPTAA
jgi:drug/metabolite transporter (DMT)-like permease